MFSVDLCSTNCWVCQCSTQTKNSSTLLLQNLEAVLIGQRWQCCDTHHEEIWFWLVFQVNTETIHTEL